MSRFPTGSLVNNKNERIIEDFSNYDRPVIEAQSNSATTTGNTNTATTDTVTITSANRCSTSQYNSDAGCSPRRAKIGVTICTPGPCGIDDCCEPTPQKCQDSSFSSDAECTPGKYSGDKDCRGLTCLRSECCSGVGESIGFNFPSKFTTSFPTIYDEAKKFVIDGITPDTDEKSCSYWASDNEPSSNIDKYHMKNKRNIMRMGENMKGTHKEDTGEGNPKYKEWKGTSHPNRVPLPTDMANWSRSTMGAGYKNNYYESILDKSYYKTVEHTDFKSDMASGDDRGGKTNTGPMGGFNFAVCGEKHNPEKHGNIRTKESIYGDRTDVESIKNDGEYDVPGEPFTGDCIGLNEEDFKKVVKGCKTTKFLYDNNYGDFLVCPPNNNKKIVDIDGNNISGSSLTTKEDEEFRKDITCEIKNCPSKTYDVPFKMAICKRKGDVNNVHHVPIDTSTITTNSWSCGNVQFSQVDLDDSPDNFKCPSKENVDKIMGVLLSNPTSITDDGKTVKWTFKNYMNKEKRFLSNKSPCYNFGNQGGGDESSKTHNTDGTDIFYDEIRKQNENNAKTYGWFNMIENGWEWDRTTNTWTQTSQKRKDGGGTFIPGEAVWVLINQPIQDHLNNKLKKRDIMGNEIIGGNSRWIPGKIDRVIQNGVKYKIINADSNLSQRGPSRYPTIESGQLNNVVAARIRRRIIRNQNDPESPLDDIWGKAICGQYYETDSTLSTRPVIPEPDLGCNFAPDYIEDKAKNTCYKNEKAASRMPKLFQRQRDLCEGGTAGENTVQCGNFHAKEVGHLACENGLTHDGRYILDDRHNPPVCRYGFNVNITHSKRCRHDHSEYVVEPFTSGGMVREKRNGDLNNRWVGQWGNKEGSHEWAGTGKGTPYGRGYAAHTIYDVKRAAAHADGLLTNTSEDWANPWGCKARGAVFTYPDMRLRSNPYQDVQTGKTFKGSDKWNPGSGPVIPDIPEGDSTKHIKGVDDRTWLANDSGLKNRIWPPPGGWDGLGCGPEHGADDIDHWKCNEESRGSRRGSKSCTGNNYYTGYPIRSGIQEYGSDEDNDKCCTEFINKLKHPRAFGTPPPVDSPPAMVNWQNVSKSRRVCGYASNTNIKGSPARGKEADFPRREKNGIDGHSDIAGPGKPGYTYYGNPEDDKWQNDAATNMASRWKDWCFKRGTTDVNTNNRPQDKTVYTYLGGQLGDVVPCNERNIITSPAPLHGTDSLKQIEVSHMAGLRRSYLFWGRGGYEINNLGMSNMDTESDDPNRQRQHFQGSGDKGPNEGKPLVASQGADGWDWAAQYKPPKPGNNNTPGNFLYNYIDNNCSQGITNFNNHKNAAAWGIHSQLNKYTPTAPIKDYWTSWGGVYPHTSSNLVGYGADGRWGSENNKYKVLGSPAPHLWPQNTFFHPISPLSLMGVKTYKDINSKSGLGEGFEKDFDRRGRGSQADVLVTPQSTEYGEYDHNWRPRHVYTSMTSCDDVDGKFPELNRNKLFFDTDQKTTSLYPSELSSQTHGSNYITELIQRVGVKDRWKGTSAGTENKDNPAGNLGTIGERTASGQGADLPERARGGILRGCMRKQQDYDAENILHCCITGKPLNNSENDMRKDDNDNKYTCPAEYCRNLRLEEDGDDNLTTEEKERQIKNGSKCGSPNSAKIGGIGPRNPKYCIQMSEKCANLGAEVCGQVSTGNKMMEALCDAYSRIQPSKYNREVQDKCTWFFNDYNVRSLFSKTDYKNFDTVDIKTMKKLYNTLNNGVCQQILRKLYDEGSIAHGDAARVNFCKNTVERAYGKCVPKASDNPTSTDIDKCRNRKNDPTECNKDRTCRFEHIDPQTNQEYKLGDDGVVEYYRKTLKGSLLSKKIKSHDNNLDGDGLIEKIKNSNIHQTVSEEGIGADFCGCHHDNDTNNYNIWYKDNKSFSASAGGDTDLHAGENPICWTHECSSGNFMGEKEIDRECDRTIINCVQKMTTNINVDGGGKSLKSINLGSEKANQLCNVANQDTSIVSIDGAVSTGGMDPLTAAEKLASDLALGVGGDEDKLIDDIMNRLKNTMKPISGDETTAERKTRNNMKNAKSNTNTLIIIFVSVVVVIGILFAAVKYSKR